MQKHRNSMLAMAELYTRADEVDAQMVKIDIKVARLQAERARLADEHAQISAGIDAIGIANGLLKPAS